MRTRSLSVAVFGGLLGLLPTVGCQSDPVWPDRPGPKVVVSFAPYYSFAAAVGGEDVVVKPLMTTQGPHHADFGPDHARLVHDADICFVNGLGLDDGVARKLDGAVAPRLKVIDLGSTIAEDDLLVGICHHVQHQGHAHNHDTDPHVWLGIDNAIGFVGKIRDDLKAIDPGHAAGYDTRAAEYTATLEKLKVDGKEMLQDKTDRQIISFHESLTYFANTFALDIVDVVQKTPGKEPSGKDLEQLIETCVDNQVRVIAVEPQYSAQSSAAQIIAELKRRGIKDPVLVEIDPLETANAGDLSAGWYEAKMRQNLRNLADAMK